MNANKILISVGIAATLVSSVFAADDLSKQHPVCTTKPCSFEHKKFNRHDMMDKKMVEMLNLSKEQKEQLAALKSAMKEQLKDGFKDRPTVGSYIKNGVFDKDSFTTDSKDKISKMVEARAEFMSKFVAILTSEQKAKLAEWKPMEHGKKK